MRIVWASNVRRTLVKTLIAMVSTTVLYCAFAVSASAVDAGGAVEDIYVVRSLRLSRIKATSFCATSRTGFAEMSTEDQYNFQSVRTKTSDGTVSDANVETVGTLHACFGATQDPTRFSFYAEGTLGGTPFIGRGDCLMARQDFPEQGLRLFRCFLDLWSPGSLRGWTFDYEHRHIEAEYWRRFQILPDTFNHQLPRFAFGRRGMGTKSPMRTFR
jgi:hypothetical protein